jgi:hypothetical protein
MGFEPPILVLKRSKAADTSIRAANEISTGLNHIPLNYVTYRQSARRNNTIICICQCRKILRLNTQRLRHEL